MSYITKALSRKQDREDGLGNNDNAVLFNAQDFQKLRRECLDRRTLFCDPTFPATWTSLGYNQLGRYSSKTMGLEWKRPTELCSNPQFILDGATRTDIRQGELGDCWLLAAIASLTMDKEILARVVPPEQSFTESYAGIFHFQLWQYGEWVDVVIDDRLPTRNGELLFVHSAEGNEFWSALLEKAYAMVNSSYEALSGGTTTEGFEDFTGGIAESYELSDAPPTLFNIIRKALSLGSLLGCSIDITSSAETEAVTRQKLVKGHAYSVTGAEVVHMYGSPVQLVRIRNPWGQVEWTGAWSDNSKEWDRVLPEEKSKLDYSAEDGEFWMAYSEFLQQYSKLEICNLTPDTLSSDSVGRWSFHQFEGTWRVGCTAGGCRNNPATFCSNPQFVIKLEDVDDDPHDGVDGCSFLVGLMQKDGRKERQFGRDLNTIGFAIYKVTRNHTIKGLTNVHLGPNVLLREKSVAMSNTFINTREVCSRFKLPPGEYVIIPSTFEPHCKGSFILRVFTEKQATARYIPRPSKISINWQSAKAWGDSEISAIELQKILDKVAICQGTFSVSIRGFGLDVTQKDGSGTLGLLEFHTLWMKMQKYLEIFKHRDTDHSGTLSSHEMREALAEAGFQLNTPVLQVIVSRYADQQSAIDFDCFVGCLIRLEMLFHMFETFDKKNTGKIELDIMQVHIYSYVIMMIINILSGTLSFSST
uniref:Calpain 8 n=1 Tax=Electrophorus electricus TaxID=8005 RepID=A0A4W4HRA0_ELEEL